MNPLDEIVAAHHGGTARCLVSVCSAHPWVLRAAMQRVAAAGGSLLVESTCNQVNQFGGYTGMTPLDFTRFVNALAAGDGLLPASGSSRPSLMLGGDHLGPYPWQDEPARSAMAKAIDLVRDYVRAGYSKIHLDASMRLGDDPPGALPAAISARRAAKMAMAAEQAFAGRDDLPAPRYVIGSEVPVPGGAQVHEDGLAVTTVESVAETLQVTQQAFYDLGLQDAWQRVIAVVVQPGVEFGDDFVIEFEPRAALGLKHFIEGQPGLVYEAHSTDYQTPQALHALVENHFAFLKVGPALTFAFREAVFALAQIENELLPSELCSNIVQILEDVMLRHPQHWLKYYPGDATAQRFARKYSLSDRVRYYWAYPEVQRALQRLLENLQPAPIPLALLSQYLPAAYRLVRQGQLVNTASSILVYHIQHVLDDYPA